MKYIFSFLLLAPLFTIAQYTLQGKVINRKTQKGIPYATIGLTKRNIGTNANEEGNFQLTSTKDLQEDTLLISCTGYQLLQLPVSTFTSNTIMLNKDTALLATVTVKPRTDWQTTTLNDFHDCKERSLSSNGSQAEVALHLQLPTDNGYLKEVKICQGGFGSFGADKTIFRLKIYGFDTLMKGPSEILYTQLVETKSKLRSATTAINLERAQVYLPQKDFFVAVEWLKIPINEMKFTSTLNGVEQDFLWYRPNLSGTTSTGNHLETWSKNYKNSWRIQSDANIGGVLAIAAIVKY